MLMKKEMGSNIIARLMPIHRMLISAAFAAIFYFFSKQYKMSPELRIVAVWDVFAILMLASSWIIFFTRKPEEIRNFALQDDGSRIFVVLIILLSSFISMITVLLLMLTKDVANTPKIIYLPVAIGGMMLSWIMVHTTFTFHYANRYYDDDKGQIKKMAGGLHFPEEESPDYLDFAYYSFTIGMTFQVSDVETSTRVFRRLTLLHSVLSFALNTFVVALTINLIASLKQ